MKNKPLIIVVILLIIAIGSFYFLTHQTASSPKQKIPASIKLKTFQGTNPPFDFSFEYPEAWEANEVRIAQQGLNMVQVFGPQDKLSKVVPGIFINLRQLKASAATSVVAEAIVQQEKKFKTFKSLFRKEEQVGGVKALHVGFQYALSLPMNSRRAKKTVLKREEVYLERKGMAYQISFWLTEEQYKIYKPIFDHVLKTLRFINS